MIGDRAFWSLVIVDIWAAWPFIYMMVIAGLQSIPSECTRRPTSTGSAGTEDQVRRAPADPRAIAARPVADHTGAFQQLRSAVSCCSVVRRRTPALTLPVNVYQTSFQVFRFGLGAAMSVITLILMIIPAVLLPAGLQAHRRGRRGLNHGHAPDRPPDPQRLLPTWLQVTTIVILMLWLLPVVYMVIISISPDLEAAAGKLWPSDVRLQQLHRHLVHRPVWPRGLTNSFIAAGAAGLIATFFGLGAAYCLTRFKFRGRGPFLNSLVGLQSVPGVMIILPLFVMFSSVGSTIGIQSSAPGRR